MVAWVRAGKGVTGNGGPKQVGRTGAILGEAEGTCGRPRGTGIRGSYLFQWKIAPHGAAQGAVHDGAFPSCAVEELEAGRRGAGCSIRRS